ncbi:MAG TPA: hemolysin III family protein [Mycobacteriales bacterium]|nr:hemolysin III family protein [Mycobacteriales bacterium]
MRGWIHLYAFAVAVVGGIVLCSLAGSRPGWVPLASCAVYAMTSCGLFGISALYHRRTWRPLGYAVMKRLDHAMIFIFIAGTYTPFSLLLLPKRTGEILLGVVWLAAIAGATMKLIWPRAPRWVAVPLYLAIGWAAVVVLPDMMTSGGVAALVLLGTGGLAYTIGAIFYATKWPNPWPKVFGHHEFFHAATVVAAICHNVAVYLILW